MRNAINSKTTVYELVSQYQSKSLESNVDIYINKLPFRK